MRSLRFSFSLVGLALAALGWPLIARGSDAFLEAPAPEVAEASPAYRYAQMPSDEAIAELRRRNILFERVDPIGRVQTPIRLTGLLHGVHIHSSLPEEERTSTVFELCDARLALVLDDFSAMLAKRDVVEVVHYTMYRPGVDLPTAQSRRDGAFEKGAHSKLALGWVGARGTFREALASEQATGRSAKRGTSSKTKKKGGKGKAAVRQGSRAARGSSATAQGEQPRRGAGNSRHPDGLAIDVGSFRKRDGTWLSVANDFGGTLGARTCGPGASPPKSERAAELWAIVCEAHAHKLFTYVLTPNFDEPHRDHLHMEIKPGVRWFLYH